MRRHIAFVLLTALVLGGAVVVRLIDPAPIARLRLLAFDAYQQMSPRSYDPGAQIRIVDIDDKSLREIGQWPWPRATVADLTRKLNDAGAIVVGFDIVMAEPDRLATVGDTLRRLPPAPEINAVIAQIEALPSGDETLAAAIAEADVVLGFIGIGTREGQTPRSNAGFAIAGDDARLFAPHFESGIASLAKLQEPAKGTGSLNWTPEHDQIIRRLPLVVSVGDKLMPSLAAELLRVGQGASTYIVKSSGASGVESFGTRSGISEIRIGQVTVPTDPAGQLWLHFTKSDRRRFVSASDVLAGRVPEVEIKDRIVLIGTSAAGLFDLRTTPLDASISGVEVHAQAIEQMIAGVFLLRPDYAAGAEIVLLVLAGSLLAAAVYLTGALWSAAIGALVLASSVTGSWVLFKSYGLLFDPVFGALTLTLLFISTTGYIYLQTEAERNRVRNAFSRYLAPALVEEIAADPSKLKLGGETRCVTLMFTDVRGFTGIAQRMDAQRLTRFINSLLSPLSTVILDHRGTIDKYIGDAIVAFWNAPLDDPRHERNAALSALAMQGEIIQLNARWRAEAEALGEPFESIRMGIGLNTAECVVGNLGSDIRFDYSVLGDGVNVASRLEEMTKTYQWMIIAGERTALACPELAFLEIDYTTVSGRSEPVRVFALLGDEAVRESPAFAVLLDAQTAWLEAYRSGDRAAAMTALAEVEARAWPGLERLIDLYRAHLDATTTGTDPAALSRPAQSSP